MGDEKRYNRRLLKGMACPGCGSLGPFKLNVTLQASALINDKTLESVDISRISWDDEGEVTCTSCGTVGTSNAFHTDLSSPDAVENRGCPFCGTDEPATAAHLEECRGRAVTGGSIDF